MLRPAPREPPLLTLHSTFADLCSALSCGCLSRSERASRTRNLAQHGCPVPIPAPSVLRPTIFHHTHTRRCAPMAGAVLHFGHGAASSMPQPSAATPSSVGGRPASSWNPARRGGGCGGAAAAALPLLLLRWVVLLLGAGVASAEPWDLSSYKLCRCGRSGRGERGQEGGGTNRSFTSLMHVSAGCRRRPCKMSSSLVMIRNE